MARIGFSRAEFRRWIDDRVEETRNWAHPVPAVTTGLNEIFSAMADADDHRARRAILDHVSDLTNYHGVEGLGEGLDYVNTGETYDQTLLYDSNTDTFLLGSYGGWIEAWEQERRVEEVEDEPPESDQRPTWMPGDTYPMIAMLRATDGTEVAVHSWWSESKGDADFGREDLLAFSVPVERGRVEERPGDYGEEFYAQREDRPYTNALQAFEQRFREGFDRIFVFAPDTLQIHYKQFERLLVALDAFYETDSVFQPVDEFLFAPPLEP